QQDRDALAQVGGELIGYLPDNAYIVRMPASRTDATRAITSVRWVGSYEVAYRLDGALLKAKAYLEQQPVRYNILVANKHTDKPALAAKIAAIGGKVEDQHFGSILIDATLTGPQLLQVAGFDQVLWIDCWSAPETDMDNARMQGGGNYVEAQAGYTGTGVRAHVYEG